MYKRQIYVMILFLMVLSACSKDSGQPSRGEKPDKNYYTRQKFVVQTNYNFLAFDTCMSVLGLLDTLVQPGPFTTLIPINSALNSWAPIGNGGYVYRVSLPSNAFDLFRYLIIPGNYLFGDLKPGGITAVRTMAGPSAYISKYIKGSNAMYAVNGVQVSQVDYTTGNGPIQVLTGMVNPEVYPSVRDYAGSDTALTFLNAALSRTGLDKVLSGPGAFTLLAPVNNAFRSAGDPSLGSMDSLLRADTARLANILRYHIIPGRQFLFDFKQYDNGRDTVKFATLNGEEVGMLFRNKWGQSVNQFFGRKNTGPATPYSPTYNVFVYDQPTGNGNVHDINRLLLP